jgi:uncharacterized protein (TIGR03382 family)
MDAMRLLVLPVLLATTWYVKPGGTGNGTQGNPFGTVQQGANAADAGDTVQLAPGKYVENVSVAKDGVTLTAQTPGTAVIDGQKGAGQQKPTLMVKGANWEILGLVLVDGGVENLLVSPASCPSAGGVVVRGLQTGGPVLTAAGGCVGATGNFNSWDVRVDCLEGPVVIEKSRLAATACSSSIYVGTSGPSVLIQENDLSGAHVDEVLLDTVDGGEVRRNLIHGPCCDGLQGNTRVQTFGLHASACTNVYVHHNLVIRAGQYGLGAVNPGNRLANENVDLSNNTLVGEECGLRFNAVSGSAHSNLVSEGACADAGCDNTCGEPCGVDVVNTQGGTGETVSLGFDLFDFEGAAKPICVQTATAFNIIDAGPTLLVPAGFVNPAQGDYRLLSTSPAIDQGDPATPPGVDFDGNPEPVAGKAGDLAVADIGAFEFQWDGGGEPPDAGGDGGGPGPDGGVDAGTGPVAVIVPAQQTVDAGVTVVLDGTQSSAPTGRSLVTYQWTQVEGPTGLSATAAPMQSFTLQVPGTYAFQLVVQDSTGQQSAPASGTVTVNGEVAPPGLTNGCGCGSGGAAMPWALLWLVLMGIRRAEWSAASTGLRSRSPARSSSPRA